QPRVDLAVHAGDEEGGHGVDLRQVAAGGIGQLEPGEVGLHDVLVPLDGEDQRDVDADALTDGRGDRGQARLGGRDLDEQVLPADHRMQVLDLLDGALGVVGQARVDLDADPAVDALRGGMDLGEHVGGLTQDRKSTRLNSSHV